MKLKGWMVIAFFSLIYSGMLMADKILQPALMLNQIKVQKTGEVDGDELYFSIAVYRADKTTYYLRVPQKPNHWPSQIIEKIKLFPLWSEPLKNNEEVTLIVSLMESDDSDLNPDDLIGSLRVTIKNDQGALNTNWSIPNRMDGPTTVSGQKGDIQKFVFIGENSQYDAYFTLKVNNF